MGQVAWLEVLDRDGHPRQSFGVASWPLRVGRALDNDVVLSDPHVAAHHLNIQPVEHGLEIALVDTRNGALLGRKQLREGERTVLGTTSAPIDMTVGRTHLRLRLPEHAVAAELPLAPVASLAQGTLPIALSLLLLLAGTVFTTYLDTDPEALTRAIGNTLLGSAVGGLVWCTAWALMSKTFTRQAQFGWHLRVFVYASLALLVAGVLPSLLAFAFSWPWLSDFDFVATVAVVATALYFHLRAVEPTKHRSLKWAALGCAVSGVALTIWFNLQRNDQPGEELYMNRLFPPTLRLAAPVGVGPFIDGLATLQPTLDEKAREPASADDVGRIDQD